MAGQRLGTDRGEGVSCERANGAVRKDGRFRSFSFGKGCRLGANW